MADDIDKASDQAQMILDKQIQQARKLASVNPFENMSGICYECDAPVPDGRRWCSIECRDVAEKNQ